MPPDDENPFERFEIDPLGGPGAITERMRELIEDAPDEAAEKAIRAAWEELTLHPARRFHAALGAHPDSHGPRGAPPPKRRHPDFRHEPLTLSDLALRPRLLDALGTEEPPALPDVPLDHDPILGPSGGTL